MNNLWNGFSTDDLCVDYKLKFGVKKQKLSVGDIQLGIFINKESFATYKGIEFEYYLHISLIKWCISIGWFLNESK